MDGCKFGSYLERAVESRNMMDIRGALIGIIDGDPAFRTGRFDDALRYLSSLGIDVYEPHDPQYPIREAGWDKEYFSLVVTHLGYNFSSRRIGHLKEVGSRIMADDPVYLSPSPDGSGTPQDPEPSPKPQANIGKSFRFPAVPVLAAVSILLIILLIMVILN